MPVVLGVLVAILAVVAVYVVSAVKIVRPYQRGVIERLGKYRNTADPGLRIILPFVERMKAVDMREQVIDVPPQEVITQDNVTAAVDAVVYFEPTDPQRLLYNISNFILAVTKLAQTNLRNVIGEMSLDEAFTSRERVNVALREILDDATDKWGVRVVRVEIQRIDPPSDVMHAMHEQMKAERTRRAVVTEAEGAREAAVTRAEGEKTAAILSAEGVRQRNILLAEGDAQAVMTRAEAEKFRQEVVADGEANAIQAVYSAIIDAGTDDRVIAIKYLESLEHIANGNSTKIFLPADMSAALGAIGGIGEMIKEASQDERPPRKEQPVRGDRQRPVTQAAPSVATSSSSSAAVGPRQASGPVQRPPAQLPPLDDLPPAPGTPPPPGR